jgi:lipoic acid synthetase
MHVTHLPAREYDHVLQLQQKISEMLRAGKLTEGQLLLGEHDPVITLGKATEPGDVKPDLCVAMSGIPIKNIERGGRATLHNPGQLVGYLVCKTHELNINDDPTRLVRQLEDVIIQTLVTCGVKGEQREDAPGVWVGDKKVAFIGIEWDGGQLMHGFSVNLNNDLDDFWKISPCGFDPAVITSVSQILGKNVNFWEFAERLQAIFGNVFHVSLNPRSYSDLLLLTGMRPPWLAVSHFQSPAHYEIQQILNKLQLDTVCESAVCPNRGECFSNHTATFLLMGNCCTRNCTFCAIPKGKPSELDYQTIPRIAEAVQVMNLDYVVLTSVTRDDLPDGGAGYIARAVTEIRRARPRAQIEVLIPDCQGEPDSLVLIAASRPDVLNHNVETVPRLYRKIRPQASFDRSLGVLRYFREYHPPIETKSGIMVGLGETREELEDVFKRLAENSVSTLTIGQYLQPTSECAKIKKYYTPGEFVELAELAESAGIQRVFSAPLVRSSYHAAEVRSQAEIDKKN